MRNQTRNQASAGDEVILLRLDQGMQEEARTRTDDLGAFTIKVQFPDKLHVVRVMHQGVNYDRRASAGNTLTIDVFDAAPKVQGVTGSIEIIRAGANGELLHVSDMIEIKNESSPPLTQAGERTFDVFLPAKAKLGSVMAAGPGKMAVLIKASPAPGEPGHYAVNFPLRPGSTKFAFNYDLPYGGHAAFRPRLAYPFRQLAVMIPPTMKFASRSPAFELLATGNSDYQVHAANRLLAGEGPGFEISGNGTIPPLENRAQSGTGSQRDTPRSGSGPAAGDPGAQASTQSDLRDATPLAAVTPPTLAWWILGTTALLVMGACGFLIWRARRHSAETDMKTNRISTRAHPGSSTASLLEALKEQLLELETDKLEGSISREEYDAAKRALDGTIRRALARAAAKS